MADTPSSAPPSPQQVFARIQDSVLEGTGITFVYAEDAVHEWPFPMPGSPGRLSGRAQITAFFDRIRGTASRLRFEEFTDVVVHDTTDPEVIVAEYNIRGTITSTGRPFVFSYILVLRVHDGEVVSLRDYLNPLAMSEALGGPVSIDEMRNPAAVSPPVSHLDLLERPLFAHVATVRPDGSPQSNVMWFAWDDPVVHLTHSRGGQKFENLSKHPSLALSISDPDNPYRYLEVRGQLATIDDDPDGAFFAQLAERYDSPVRLEAAQLEGRVRLVIRLTGFHAVGA